MRPEVTDESNPGSEGAPTCWPQVDGCCGLDGECPGLARSTYSLGFDYAPSFSCRSPSGDLALPAWTVQGLCLPAAGVNTDVFEGGFQAIFEALLLSSHSLFTLAQLAIRSCFGSLLSGILTV